MTTTTDDGNGQNRTSEPAAGFPNGTGYFRYTYAWNSFLERMIPITLTTTSGALVFGNPTAYAPDIDKITVAPAVVGTPTTVRR